MSKAELQKIRVEMAAMKRDAEHYSRQVSYFSQRLYFMSCHREISYLNRKMIPCIILQCSSSSDHAMIPLFLKCIFFIEQFNFDLTR